MKSVFFIDGFNLYHAIDKSFAHNKYKWLDLRLLAENFIGLDEQISKIIYFTAYARWDQIKTQRHKTYVAALTSRGVEIAQGKFKRVEKNFNKRSMPVVSSDKSGEDLPDRLRFQSFEEKETDVNIAVKLLEHAAQNQYDKFYIISGDSDFLPAIRSIKRNHRSIKLISILPIRGKGFSLKQVCDEQRWITEDHLKNSLLNDQIKIGSQTITKPVNWK